MAGLFAAGVTRVPTGIGHLGRKLCLGGCLGIETREVVIALAKGL
jgi:hypothetical protein